MMLRYIVVTLVCCFLCQEAHGHSARLFIALSPKCTFTVEDLQRELGGVIIEGGRHGVKDVLDQLEDKDDNHLILLKDRICNLAAFARRHGYAYQKLTCSLECAIKKVRKLQATLPTTDKDLPRLHAKDVGLFYDLMKKVDGLFKAHKLTYWATCGTLLGAVRHRGMIPWDDDLDIAIFEKDLPRLLLLEKVLAKEGLAIGFHPTYEIYKIYPVDGKPIIDPDGQAFDWKYPFVDIFPLAEFESVYTYAAPIWKNNPKLRKRDHFLPQELRYPLAELDFGPLKLPAPHNASAYLDRMYGKDWNRVAYVMFSHRHEKHIPKIKVDLINPTPPAYYMPKGSNRRM